MRHLRRTNPMSELDHEGRNRNTVLFMLTIVVVLGLIAGRMLFGSDDGTTVAANGDQDGSSPPAASPTVSVERTEVVASSGGTTPVVTDFDQDDARAAEQDDAEAAESVVSAFLDDLRSGDVAAAAERWTGYPELGPDALPAEKTPFIAELRADPVITRILHGNAETFVTAPVGRSSLGRSPNAASRSRSPVCPSRGEHAPSSTVARSRSTSTT
jgi:hypothetical protein